MTKRFVKPKAGLVVRRPENAQQLPAEGAEVNWNSYWARRVADGSVTQSKTKPAQAKTQAKANPKKQEADGS